MPLLARRAASATERTLVYFRMNMYITPPMRLSSSPTHQSISGRCWTRAYFRDGSNAHFDCAPATSGLPRLADILKDGRHVSKVPTADLLAATSVGSCAARPHELPPPGPPAPRQ